MGKRTTFYFFQCCCVCKDVFGGCLLRLYLSTISITCSNSTKWVRSRHAMTGSSEIPKMCSFAFKLSQF